MKLFSLVILALLLAIAVPSHAASPIKKVVYLMLENHSLDTILGHLKQTRPDFAGVLPGEYCNYVNATDPTSQKVCFSYDGPDAPPMDPCHSVGCTADQLWGFRTESGVPTMDGFLQDAVKRHGAAAAPTVLKGFSGEHLPVITALANEFAVFDHMFAAVPGPTMVNRMFALSATSYGDTTNTDILRIIEGYPQTPIFKSLDDAGFDWKVYTNEVSGSLYFKYVRDDLFKGRFYNLDTFTDHAKNTQLPTFSWISPIFFSLPDIPASDQHPEHLMHKGEQLIKEVYEALRSGPNWNDTLLIINYDEHGGFSDSVPPPSGVPNPDGRNGLDPAFDFTRLGVRIPFLAISPWIPKGHIEHEPPAEAKPASNSAYDHTSVLATMQRIFGLPHLNKRDSWAATFNHIINQTVPRTDCPMTLPQVNPWTDNMVETAQDGSAPLTDLHWEWITLAAGLAGEQVIPSGEVLQTEADGAYYVRSRMAQHLGRELV